MLSNVPITFAKQGSLQVTTVNQKTAARSANMEPLKTLGDMGRKGSQLGWDADRTWKSLVFFGEDHSPGLELFSQVSNATHRRKMDANGLHGVENLQPLLWLVR